MIVVVGVLIVVMGGGSGACGRGEGGCGVGFVSNNSLYLYGGGKTLIMRYHDNCTALYQQY